MNTLPAILKQTGILVLALAATVCLNAQNTSSSSSYNSNYIPNSNQTYNNQRTPRYTGHSWTDRFVLEGGGGVTPPVGNTQNFANTGWNALLGGGLKFNNRLSLLAEWNFNWLGMPRSLAQAQGTPDGNEHLWTIDLNPKFNVIHSGRMEGYVIGGGGFSRALINYTAPVVFYCFDYYFGPFPCSGSVTVARTSSNQGNWDIGGGSEWRVSPYERGSLFLEARYERLMTPNRGPLPPGPNASYIPVTFGYRW